jgi:hypothetical protein
MKTKKNRKLTIFGHLLKRKIVMKTTIKLTLIFKKNFNI